MPLAAEPALERDPVRAQFLAAAVLFVLLFAMYAWQQIGRARDVAIDELRYYNRLFVEGTRASLIVQQSRLLMLGEQLRALGAMDVPARGRTLIDEVTRADPGALGFGLARADGQLLLVGEVAFGKLPNLRELPEAREGFERALREPGLTVARAYRSELLQAWVMPLRLPLPEADGVVRWVVSAGLRIDGSSTVWGRMQTPRHTAVALVRDDGYLQYSSTAQAPWMDATEDPAVLYATPLAGDEIAARIRAAGSEGSSAVLRSRNGARVLASLMRLPEHGLTAVAWVPLLPVYVRALRALVLPAGLVLVYLAAAWGAYAITRRAQRHHEQRLVHLAHHDPLTGLPNRALVMDRLRQALAISVRQDRSAALLFADLDNFKHINDTWGHRFGDELIKLMGNIFAESVRPGDTVARLGGDEFLLVLPDLADDADAKRVAVRILERFRAPIQIGEQQVYTSASIGIAIGPRDAAEPEELLRLADIALYDAKGRGRHCYSFFDTRLNESARRRTEIERHLRPALAHGELSVAYQPIYRLGTPPRMRGVEALVRWHSPELGHVAPEEFIRVAEDAGLVGEIGVFVQGRACAEIAGLNRDLGADLSVSINVSATEFRAGTVAEGVRRALQQGGLAPRNLVLELTESVMIEDLASVKAQLLEVRRIGAHIAVDDFGTGYSSLSYLNRLPVGTLKIDRAFARDLGEDPEDRALVRSIIALGHGLDMVVVAEGVETAEQVDALTALGCDLLQGYFFSPPVPLARLRELVAGALALPA